MDEPRVLLLGVGNFGRSWAEHVIPACGDVCEFAAAVDQRPERLAYVPEGTARFTDLDEALQAVHPDLVINVTPPHLHTGTNLQLLSSGYAVLCEKPIAETPEDAQKLAAFYQEKGGFLMIADNYRYAPVFRACRQMLASGEMGNIHSVQCHFRHYHADFSAFYHGRLAQPLLLDVTVHHLDVARYLMGQEPVRTVCETWSAPYSWYGQRPANALIRSWMTGNVLFTYFGTLAAPSSTTDWNGNWEIECDRGTLKIIDSQLYLCARDDQPPVLIPSGGEEKADTRTFMLREAIDALRTGRKGETDLTDNIKTYRWIQNAIRSSQTKTEINFEV